MDSSLFGKLPPELRNRIYTLAMSREKTITFAPQSDHPSRRILRPLLPSHRPPQGFSLTAACRQMRQECSMLFYACNDFAFVHGIGSLKAFTRRIRKHNSRALRSVTIKLFAHIHMDSSGPTGLYLNARNNVRGYGKLAKRYGWTSAKGEVKFESLSDTSELFYATFNMADLGEEWDQHF